MTPPKMLTLPHADQAQSDPYHLVEEARLQSLVGSITPALSRWKRKTKVCLHVLNIAV
jgi:hypothetical protein